MLRHLYQEKAGAAPATAKALKEAFGVLRHLGAALEEVRIQPSTSFNDEKVVSGESEIHAVHALALRERSSTSGRISWRPSSPPSSSARRTTCRRSGSGG